MSPASVLVLACLAANPSDDLFPFVMPWDDATPSVVDLSGWNRFKGQALPRVNVSDDGHFEAAGECIRFLGVNLCFGACFPTHEAAERIARRMAKFGINVVRFHHMDMNRFPRGIWDRARHGRLDPEALDRLDYLLFQLKQNGIFANLNLLVSRRFSRADGLPQEIEQLDWKDQHVIGFFDERVLKLQKHYARQLLTHRNPYTGLEYREDPVVAFVEINNENGLVHAWLGGKLDNLPAAFAHVLRRKWNQWLVRRYGSDQGLRQAWGVKTEPLGREMLGRWEAGSLGPWRLELHNGARAQATVTTVSVAGKRRLALRIRVERTGLADWHVQLNHPGLRLIEGTPYTLEFWARADRPRQIRVSLRQAHEPWESLGFETSAQLESDWKRFRYAFLLSRGDANARVDFSGLSQAGAEFYIASVSLRPGGHVGLRPGQSLARKTIPILDRATASALLPRATQDWVRFLWETERSYWTEMHRFLKEELGVEALVTGTIIGCSTPHLQRQFDWIDTHAYWKHPVFPGRPWDPENWYVHNLTMVRDPQGGTLPRLALRRVSGKPHAVTEYNHSAPNTYSSEAYVLLGAYAALQDWDAIYAFAYSHRTDAWDTRYFSSFFDIDQHAGKMISLWTAASLFRRGDVLPAKRVVRAPLDADRELSLLPESRAWRLVDGTSVGLDPRTCLIHRVELDLDGSAGEQLSELDPAISLRSDTGQLLWDPQVGRVVIDSPRTKAAVGFLASGVRWRGVELRRVASKQNGWAVVALVSTKGDLPGEGSRSFQAVLSAVGLITNTGMRWKVDPWLRPLQASVGRRWGQAPVLAEGIVAELWLDWPADRLSCTALDPRGLPREPVPVRRSGRGATITIGPGYRTLWYLVEGR